MYILWGSNTKMPCEGDRLFPKFPASPNLQAVVAYQLNLAYQILQKVKDVASIRVT